MDLGNLDAEGRLALGRRIQQACTQFRLTQKDLAEVAGYDEKTIRNVIRGDKTRGSTLEHICTAIRNKTGIEIGTDLIFAGPAAPNVSTDDHGGYGKGHVEDYLGLFVSYRRSFTFPQNMLRSVYEFQWSDAKKCMVFREVQKYQSPELMTVIDYSQEGEVFISHAIGLVHLLTRYRGALRLITLTKIRLDDMTLRGSILTQAQGEFYYQPSVSPVIFQKANPSLTVDVVADQVGPIRPGDADYERMNRALAEVERKVAIFAVTPDAPASAGGTGGMAA